MSSLHGKITDEEAKALAERNEQRIKAATAALGRKHLVHPANKIKIRRQPLYLKVVAG